MRILTCCQSELTLQRPSTLCILAFKVHNVHCVFFWGFFSLTACIQFSKTATQANLSGWSKKQNLHSPLSKMKTFGQDFASPTLMTAHMFAPRSSLQGLLQLSICLRVQVKPRKRGTRTSQQMMCFNTGSDSNPDPQPVSLKLVRVEAWIYCINIHADVYLLSSSGRLS